MSLRAWVARGGGWLAVYVGLVVWLTWPLGAHLATHLPSTTKLLFDTLHTMWVLSWSSHSLAVAPLSLPDANIYHPAPAALFYGQTAFGALPYFAPVFWATGNATLATNLLFVGGVALTACSLHLVTYAWTRSELAGVVAAWTYLTTRWVLWEVVPTAPQYALLHYLPVIVLLAARTPQRFSVILFALVALQALVDPVYLGAATFVPLGVIGLVRFAYPVSRRAGASLLLGLALVALVLLAAFATHLAVRAENPGLAGQTLWTTPMASIVFPFGLIGVGSPAAAPTALLILIVVGALGALARNPGEPTRRAWAYTALWTAIGIVMLLKPTTWPILGMLRVPARNGIAALIGVAMLAGLAFAECARRLGRWRPAGAPVLAAVLIACAYAEFGNGLPVARLRRPPLPAYGLMAMAALESPAADVLARERGPVLEVPMGAGIQSARLNARAMYRSLSHWRPLVNGYDGYFPASFPAHVALARRLPDADAVRALRAETGLQTIVVNLGDLSPDRRDAWLGLARRPDRPDLQLVAARRGALVFDVVPEQITRR